MGTIANNSKTLPLIPVTPLIIRSFHAPSKNAKTFPEINQNLATERRIPIIQLKQFSRVIRIPENKRRRPASVRHRAVAVAVAVEASVRAKRRNPLRENPRLPRNGHRRRMQRQIQDNPVR